MLRQLRTDASDTVEFSSGVAPERGCNSISSNSFVFNENSITNVITALTLMLGVNGT